jgi:hypothetical protein
MRRWGRGTDAVRAIHIAAPLASTKRSTTTIEQNF